MAYPRLRPPSLPPGVSAKFRELDERADGWFSPVVKWLVYLSVTLFILRVIFPFDAWVTIFAASPASTIFHARIWQLITYALFHDREGIFHILFNLLALWFFGIRLERAWGSARFLQLCLATAAGAALVHIGATLLFVAVGLLSAEGLAGYIIGLSGVVYGVLTVYAILHPHDTIHVYGIFPIKVRTLIIALAVMAFIGSLGGGAGNIAHLGHLGGILFGWLFMRYPAIFERIPVPRIGHRRWKPPEPSRSRWRPPE